MRAWIKYKGGESLLSTDKHNYTRYGKLIPHQEIEIDICKYFGVNEERGLFIAKQLKADSRIECRLEENLQKATDRLESKNKDNFQKEVTDRFAKINAESKPTDTNNIVKAKEA